MAKSKILISVNAPLLDTREPWVGDKVVQAFLDVSEKLTPEEVFNGDSPIGPYTSANDFVAKWPNSESKTGHGLRWKRKRVSAYEAEFTHGLKNKFGDYIDGELGVEAKYDERIDWEDLFVKLSTALQSTRGTLLIFEGQLRTTTRILALDGTWRVVVKGHSICASEKFVSSEKAEMAESKGYPLIRLAHANIIKVTSNIGDFVTDRDEYMLKQSSLEALLNT